MRNIFECYDLITKLKNKSTYSKKQKQFVSSILEGNPGEDGWRPFGEIIKKPPDLSALDQICIIINNDLDAQSPSNKQTTQKIYRILKSKANYAARIDALNSLITIDANVKNLSCIKKIKKVISNPAPSELDNLIDTVRIEIKNSSFWSFSYKGDLDFIRYNLELIKCSKVNHLIRYKKIHKKLDDIYALTHSMGGKLIVPIQQYFDSRIGNSRGECFGYTYVWAKSLLMDGRFAGIYADTEVSFNYVKSNFAIAGQKPNINHLAVLTKDISDCQRLQNDGIALIKKTSIGTSSMLNIFERNRNFSFFKSISSISNKLVAIADENSNRAFLLCVRGYACGGHALGFYKKGSKYHFFDSNIGWVRFDNSADFKAWLPIYFQKTGYAKVYHEASIEAVRSIKLKPKEKSTILKKLLAGLLLLLFLAPMLPLALLYFAYRGIYTITYTIILRGLLYLALNAKNFICNSKWFSSQIPSSEDPQDLDPRKDLRSNMLTEIHHSQYAGTLFSSMQISSSIDCNLTNNRAIYV